MHDSINKFRLIRQELIEKINGFPLEKVELACFDKWSLKDVLAHLSHWMDHDISCLNAIQEGREPVWEPDIEVFNSIGVEKRKNNTWNEVYREFVEKGNSLISIYESLPQEIWHQKFWPGKEETPAKFLLEDISHWQDEHLFQMKALSD